MATQIKKPIKLFKRIFALSAAVISVFLVAACSGGTQTESKNEDNGKMVITAVSPSDGKTISIANKTVKQIYADYSTGMSDELSDGTDKYKGEPVNLRWAAKPAYDFYTVTIGLSSDFADARTYETSEGSLRLVDLFAGKQYYWQIRSSTEDGDVKSDVFTFTTESSPRTIYIDGISNTRDIGGYKLTNGKKLKQGMIYRGASPDGITENGLEDVLLYGIKTQLDLRTEAEAVKGGSFGNDVNYVNISGVYYLNGDTGLNIEKNKAVIAREMRVFIDESNYPIYFHCALGRDRTGTLAMLIEGLCGADEKDILLDYELSSLSVTGNNDGNKISYMINNLFKPTVDYLKEYGGGTLQEGVRKYLLDCGMQSYELDKIISVMTE